MSKPSALPSPLRRASRPAPTAPPAGPERTLQAPARAASAAGATPPEDCITSGSRQPRARARRLAEPPQVAAEQRAEVGVDRGRRAALVLAEARQHLVRGGDVEVGQALAQVRGDAALVGGVEVGEEQADRDRLGAAASPAARASRSGSPSASGSTTPSGPIRSVGLEAQLAARPAAPASARRAGRAGPVLAADLEQVGEALGRDQRRARPAFLQQRVGADGHPVGEGLDLAGLGAGPREHRRDRAHHPLRLGRRGWSAPWPCGPRRRRAGPRR